MPTNLSPEEIARSHRWHAVECNNVAWELAALPDRTNVQDEEMLDAAHASAFHWAKIGNELNRARARMLLGHVYAALGDGKPALAYAQRSYDYLAAQEPPDWELAFAHAILRARRLCSRRPRPSPPASREGAGARPGNRRR